MKRFSLLTLFVLVVCSQLFAQNTPGCPAVKLNAPAGITPIDGPMLFWIAITGNFDHSKLAYKWKVANAEIASGQGTVAVIVPTNRDMAGQIITATVEIKGLPANSFSASGQFPQRKMDDPIIDRYGKLKWQDEQARLKNVLEEWTNFQNRQAIFIFSYQKDPEFRLIKSRQKKILKFLADNGISKNQVRFVSTKNGFYETSIWLIPEGAMPPN